MAKQLFEETRSELHFYRKLQAMQHAVLRNMSAVARAIALPGETDAQRFPSFPALERTSVLRFNAPRSWTVGAGNGVRAVLFRQPAYPLWMEESLDTCRSYQVGWQTDFMQIGVTIANVTTSLQFAQSGAFTGGTLWPSVSGAGMVAPPSVYPPVALDIRDGSVPWVYIPNNSYAAVSVMPVTPIGTAYSAVVNFEQWLPGGQTSVLTSNQIAIAINSGGNGTQITPAGAWIRPINVELNPSISLQITGFRIAVSVILAGATPTLSGNIVGSAPTIVVPSASTKTHFVPSFAPNEYTSSMIPWESTRCTAVAALFTNTTKVLNKEGTVQWGRLNPEIVSPWAFSLSDISTLHPSEKAFMGLEKGTYAYVPPSTDQGSFWDHTLTVLTAATSTSFSSVPVFRLDNTSLCCAAIFTDPDGGTSMAINLDWHLEFRNVSALFPIALSSMSLESFHQAQLALVESGFFFANESHNAILNRVLGYVKKYASAAGLVHPMLGKAAQLIGAMHSAPKKPLIAAPPPRRLSARKSVRVKRSNSTTVRPRAGKVKASSTSGKRSGIK